eukprot:1592643-Pleurochrysis_carterae.AAC.1
MHGFPICIRIACVLAERSRSAPQALGNSLVWPPLPIERPSRSHRKGALEPADIDEALTGNSPFAADVSNEA